MQHQLAITIPVADGRLNPSEIQKSAIAEFLRTREGKAVSVTFRVPSNPRTLKQNAYYWAVVLTTIATQLGYSTEEVHSAVKDMFLPRKFLKLGSREVEVRKTTTDLTFTEFQTYLEQVRAWASTELGLAIPLPNE